jgi:hypothetical protein
MDKKAELRSFRNAHSHCVSSTYHPYGHSSDNAYVRQGFSPSKHSFTTDPRINISNFETNKALLKLESTSSIAAFCLRHIDTFNAVNIATACHRLAKKQRSSNKSFEIVDQSDVVKKALNALTEEALHKASTFKPQELANLMWALAVVRFQPSTLLIQKLLDRALATIEGFAPQHIANLAWALATLKIRPNSDVFEALSTRSVAISSYLKPQEIANLLWSMATIGFHPSEVLVDAISLQSVSSIQEFKSQEIVNVLWAMATLNIRPCTRMVHAMLMRAELLEKDFQPKGVANFMSALAKIGVRPSTPLFQAMFRQAITKSRQFNPIDIASLVWALVTLHAAVDEDSEMVLALLQQAVAIAQRFQPPEITTLMWGLANLRIKPPNAFVDIMSFQVTTILECFSAHDHALLIWSCSKLGVGRNLVIKMLNLSSRVVARFKSQDICDLLWAVVNFDLMLNDELLLAISSRTFHLSNQLNPLNISCVIWALAKQGMAPEERLLNSLMQRAALVSSEFQPQEIVNFMWGLATLNIEPEVQLLEAVLLQAVSIVNEFKLQEVCTLVWAIACLGLHHRDQFSAALSSDILYRFLSNHPSNENFFRIPDEVIYQTHELAVSCQFDNFFAQHNLGELIGTDLLHFCKRAVEFRNGTKSDLQLSIASFLNDLGVSFEEQVVEPRTGFIVDMLVRNKDRLQLAVEVGDPTRCMRLSDGSWQPKGPTLFKQRLLVSAGLQCLFLPFWEWNHCVNRSEQHAYIKKFIDF